MKAIPEASRKYFKYLIYLGLFLGVAGLVAGVVSGVWSPLSIVLLACGVAIAVVGIGVTGSQPNGFFDRRSTQVGTNALVATASVLALLALLNFLAVRYSSRFDLSETKQFTLAKESQQLVAKLPKPLKVWVFVPQANPNDRELLETYRRKGSKFEFEFVDPDLKIGLAEKFNVQSEGEVYLEYGEKKQLVQTLRTQFEDQLSEGELTAAIAQMLSDRAARIYFLQGHGELSLEAGERGLSQAVTELRERGYEVDPLNLAQEPRVPEDADVVVVAGAERSLFAGEVKALQAYLKQGGSLFLAIDPKTDPKLDPLLKEWGVTLDSRLAIDASGNGSVINFGPATPLIFNYGTHPITADFGKGLSVYPLARPVDVEPIDGIQSSPLLFTNDQSWAESNLGTDDLSFDSDRDRAGPLTLGVALSKAGTKPKEDKDSKDGAKKDKPPEARLIVFGNSSFAANGWFEEQLNGDVFLNSVKWLAKSDREALSIRPKEPKNRRLFKTSIATATAGGNPSILPLMGILTLVTALLVGLAFTMAGVLWWRRR